LFVLVILHVGTRRVIVTPSTYHPNAAWMEEQAAAFMRQTKVDKLGADLMMHDRDGKFMATFDAALKQSGVDVKKSAPRSPNTVAFVERVIQTIQQECIDHFMVFGSKHM
jgi:putative transposase